MGRELKRVPIDFDWQIGKKWKGYLCPYESHECPFCEGLGYNTETKKIYDLWYNFDNAEYVTLPSGRRYNKNAWHNNLTQDDVQALVDGGRLWDFVRVPITDEQREIVQEKMAKGGNSWLPFNSGKIPTAEEVNNWAREGMGHDAINCGICVRARAEKLGVYGDCEHCNGEGQIYKTANEKQLSKKWKPKDPPIGEGYQLWETTSEGSPQSPVFSTLDLLCEWCAENATTFASFKATKREWRRMLENDFVHHRNGNLICV